MSVPRRRIVLLVLGSVAIVGGAVIAASRAVDHVAILAMYGPVPRNGLIPLDVFRASTDPYFGLGSVIVGGVLMLLGVAVIAATLGYAIGARRRTA
jgi:hypothetical protein